MEELDKRPLFLVMGPVGGNKNVLRLPERQFYNNSKIDWIPAFCESTVRRFLAEARYFLQIHNVVVQHFVSCIPFQNYAQSDAERGSKKKKRDSLYSVLWNARALDRLLNPDDAEAEQGWATGEDHQVIETELENSLKYVRDKSASTSSVNDSSSISEASSVQALFSEIPKASSSLTRDARPPLLTRVKENFKRLLDEELASLRKRLVQNLPGFAEKNAGKLYKLVMRAYDYSDLLNDIEVQMKSVVWPSYTGGAIRFIDLREDGTDDTHHVIYAPGYVIAMLENICITAYGLFEKTYDLEKKMQNLSPSEFAKLQESKRSIVCPTTDVASSEGNQ